MVRKSYPSAPWRRDFFQPGVFAVVPGGTLSVRECASLPALQHDPNLTEDMLRHLVATNDQTVTIRKLWGCN